MAKDWATGFYRSQAWRRTQAAYMASVNYLCERCGGPAAIVHHKTYLTPANIGDPNVSLAWGNLEALCQTCHNREHSGGHVTAPGLEFTPDGSIRKTNGS